VDGKKEEIRFITPDWVKSPPPVMEVGQLGSKIILGLHSLMREAQTHGTDSVALDEPISQYLHFINPFILSEGGIALEIAEDGFLLNNRKIRPKSGDHAVFKSFMKSLIGRRIGKLEIQNPLDEKELKEFVFHLIALEEGDEDNALYLMRRLDARKIDSISASRLELKEEPVPKTAEGRRRARELYFAAIGIVQEIMEGAGEGRALNMRRAKRLMQELVASFVQDEFTLLGLAMIKAYGQYLYNHSVNVAIYSIALGLRLGLPKGSLVQLGITSIFHDIGKIRIPQSVLGKSGQLDAAFEHHIKKDQAGYPKLTAKRQLTLFGKIIAIGDFYDNLGRSSSYQLFPVFSDRATGLLLDRSGRDFDPTLAKLFVQAVGIYPIGTLVMLENGEMGIVVAPNRDLELMDRPKVLPIRFQDGEYRGTEVLDLAEVEDETGKYKNTIAKPLDPNEYQLNVAELLFYG